MTPFLLVLVAALALTTGVLARRYLVLAPRRWREPLGQALRLLESPHRDNLEQAERLLGQALTGGPDRRGLARARYARAYVRAMLGRFDANRYSAAAADISELAADEGHDEATAALEIWIRARLGEHETVCALYERNEHLVRGSEPTRRTAALSHLVRARHSWRRREADTAVRHLDLVRSLDAPAGDDPPIEVPAALDRVLLAAGVQAVRDGRDADARRWFTAARDRAAHDGASPVEAELALVACDWTRIDRIPPAQRRGAVLAVDRDLELLLAHLGTPGTATLTAQAALLHLNSLLRRWRYERPRGHGLTAADWAELRRRVERVHAADPELGDADMIEGILRYELDPSDADGATEPLRRAAGKARGVLLPEILDVLTEPPPDLPPDAVDVRSFQTRPMSGARVTGLPPDLDPPATEPTGPDPTGPEPDGADAEPVPTRPESIDRHLHRVRLLLDHVHRIDEPELTALARSLDGAARAFIDSVRRLDTAADAVAVHLRRRSFPDR
ncbi:hypothetical protein [Cryptosporangium japonicum]|uniref:Secreted protein n=1 Tax=Cryptosporangium japonicum TaxID=80872 RepID=A0ABN0V654_9ACTN